MQTTSCWSEQQLADAEFERLIRLLVGVDTTTDATTVMAA